MGVSAWTVKLSPGPAESGSSGLTSPPYSQTVPVTWSVTVRTSLGSDVPTSVKTSGQT